MRVYAEATSPTLRDAMLDRGRRASDRRRAQLDRPTRPSSSTTPRPSRGAIRAACSTHIADFPDQMRAGWALSRKLTLPERYRTATAVAVLGMGGSAICGDLVRCHLRRPSARAADDRSATTTCRRGWTSDTSSSPFRTAARPRKRSASFDGTRAARRTGGRHHDRRRAGRRRDARPAAAAHVPDQTPPRAALGYTLPLLTGLLERARMLDVERRRDRWRRSPRWPTVVPRCAAGHADRVQPGQAACLGAARPVAGHRGQRLPGAGRRTAGRRSSTRTANRSAAVETLPEATHNAVVGYDQPESLHDHLYVVFLASSSDHPRNSLRATLSSELLTSFGIAYQVVPVGGEGRLAQACAAILLGDYVSTYLALLYGADPMPVDAISQVKRRLSARESARDSEDERTISCRWCGRRV